MKLEIIGAALASAVIGLSTQALAQTSTERPADAAAQPSQPATESRPEASSSAGASATGAGSSAKSDGSFTHGESKRCESLAGADKEQCDKEEATKTEGPAAQEATKKPEDSSKQ